MASFFRKKIAQKVLLLMQKSQKIEVPKAANLISSKIKVNRRRSSEPELILPWKRIENVCSSASEYLSPNELVRLLRNQGLPTAEGFIDIKLLESPLCLVFTVDKHIFSKIVLLDICTNEENLAKSSCIFEDVKKQNVVVQSSFPAVGDPFHMTHFYTAVHSKFITNIHKFAGHNVVNVAQVNDWGLKAAIFLTGFKQFEEVKKHKNSAVNLFEVMKASHLQYMNDLKFKEQADITFGKIQKGDSELIAEWQALKNVCMKYYMSVYERFGVKFDEIHFDSSCHEEATEISDMLLDKNILEENYFSEVKPGEESETDPATIGSNDSVFYNLSRYINSALQMENKHNFDRMYCIVPSNQKDFFSLLFSVLKKLNYPWAENVYQIGLSTRDIETKRKKQLSPVDVLDKVKKGMVKELNENLQMELNTSLEEMAEHLGLSSLIIHNMKRRRNVDYRLDLQEIISFKRDTGSSFQLCYAGLQGLQEDSEYYFKTDIDTSPLLEPEAHYLIQHLARFDEMVYKSYTLLEPCIMFQYLSSLWHFTDQACNVLRLNIKHDRLIVIKARLMLLSATLKIFGQGLNILGITPLENMYAPEKDFVREK